MDRFEELVSSATVAVGVYGNSETSEFCFLDFPLPETLAESITLRGVTFWGLIGIVNGQIRAVFDAPLEPTVVSALARDFLARLESEMTTMPVPVPVSWLESLHSLEDPR